MWVHVTPTTRGRIHALDASQDIEVIKSLSKHFKHGQVVMCRVLRKDEESHQVDLSARPASKEVSFLVCVCVCARARVRVRVRACLFVSV